MVLNPGGGASTKLPQPPFEYDRTRGLLIHIHYIPLKRRVKARCPTHCARRVYPLDS